MQLVVAQLAEKAAVTVEQAEEVIQRLLVYRILDDEPPTNMGNVARATSNAGLGLWLVSRGAHFTTTPIPPLQPVERIQMRVGGRTRKNTNHPAPVDTSASKKKRKN